MQDSVHPIEQCTNCGAENDPQNSFCGSCGAPLASSPAGTTGGTAVASDRAPSRGAWSMDRVRSLSTEPKREVLLSSMLAAGVSLLLVVSFYVLLLIRWAIGMGDAPGMGGLVSFVAAHGGALSVRVPPGPALFDIGGSLKIDPPITSIALLPFILLFVGSWMISRRLRTFVLSRRDIIQLPTNSRMNGSRAREVIGGSIFKDPPISKRAGPGGTVTDKAPPCAATKLTSPPMPGASPMPIAHLISSKT